LTSRLLEVLLMAAGIEVMSIDLKVT